MITFEEAWKVLSTGAKWTISQHDEYVTRTYERDGINLSTTWFLKDGPKYQQGDEFRSILWRVGGISGRWAGPWSDNTVGTDINDPSVQKYLRKAMTLAKLKYVKGTE